MSTNQVLVAGELLRDLRVKHTLGRSVKEIARQAGVSRNDWAKAERGGPIGRKVLGTIADFLRVDHKNLLRADRSTAPFVDTGSLSAPHHVPNSESTMERRESHHDRTEYLDALSKAWSDDRINIVCIRGIGGMGKTALVQAWLSSLEKQGWPRAARVLGYSFDREDVRSEQLLIKGFRDWFESTIPHRASEFRKGQDFAQEINKSRTLLILDAVERLLVPRGAGEGYIADSTLRTMIGSLADFNMGLCVLTSRERIIDLYDRERSTVMDLPLKPLSLSDSAELLRQFGVQGPDRERRRVARQCGRHGLALRLAASYLDARYGGNPARMPEVRFNEDEHRFGPIKSILKEYERWYRDRPELLHVLMSCGLFDRVIRFSHLSRAFRLVVDALGASSTSNTHRLKEHLRELKSDGLIGFDPASALVESHRMIREYFRARFIQEAPEAWKAVNLALFEDHQDIPPARNPRDLLALYDIVRHGCRAGIPERVWREVFMPKIRRNTPEKRLNFNLRKYRAFSADLSCLREFFGNADNWSDLGASMTDSERAYVLNEVGCDLRAQGNFPEAEKPLQLSAEVAARLGDSARQCEAQGNLGELYFRKGESAKAIRHATLAVELAREAENSGLLIVMLCVLGNVEHYRGNLDRASNLFDEAATLQGRDLEHPRLYGVEGFEYMDFLLSKAEYQRVEEHAAATIKWLPRTNLLMIGLTELSWATAILMHPIQPSASRMRRAETLVQRACDRIVNAGRIEYRPRAAMLKSLLDRVKGTPSAEPVLDALSIARSVEFRDIVKFR